MAACVPGVDIVSSGLFSLQAKRWPLEAGATGFLEPKFIEGWVLLASACRL